MNKASKTVTGEGKLPRDGDKIWNSGHEFIVTNSAIETNPNGHKVFRYTGICTDHKVNDSIRHTSYNGGRYGWAI